MTNLTFKTQTLSGSTYNWNTTNNWFSNQTPVNGDSVTVDTSNGNLSVYTSLDNIPSLTLNDLSISSGVTLEVGSGDGLTVQANFTNAGTLNVSGTFAVQNTQSQANTGTIDVKSGGVVTLQNINDGGNFIIEVGGQMTISYSGNINGPATFQLQGGLLESQSNTPGQADVNFDGSAAGHLAFNTTTNGNAANNQLDNMGIGDSIEFIDKDITSVSFAGNTLTLTTGSGPTLSTYNIQIHSFDSSLVNPNFILSTDPITHRAEAEVVCFLRGTRIRTPDGDRPVELLLIGDKVLTKDGESRAVRWIWRQTVVSIFADELRAYPIRIMAGALGENVPQRDLFVSPDHAIFLGDCLVHAGALVNNTTVVRVTKPEPKFVYYHIELEDHSLILAEGVPAETFVDNVTRRNFDNHADYEAFYGVDEVATSEMEVPRAKSARQVPRAVRERLAARLAVLSVEVRDAA